MPTPTPSRVTPALDADRVLAIMEAAHTDEPAPSGEGLRERKKRQLRQRISDVATALFLAEGFEAVSVARIAARADVSEQTVFNHFPTKESMLFDRADDTWRTISDAVRDRSRGTLAQVIQPGLLGQMWPYRWHGVAERDGLLLLRRFAEVADGSPTLQQTPYLAMAPFMDHVTAALAERAGTTADDPQVQLVATMIAGLLLLRRRSFQHHVRTARSLDALGRAVEADIQRALRLARPTFDAFDRAGRGS
jgi:AcrR family transcriptional regulator